MSEAEIRLAQELQYSDPPEHRCIISHTGRHQYKDGRCAACNAPEAKGIEKVLRGAK